ncbi:MAG TPA: sigma-70 family RNA polymerase sigma factor [Methylobacterium sp.]|jgi:RNA polymerase sigma factor (sigma-70 family)
MHDGSGPIDETNAADTVPLPDPIRRHLGLSLGEVYAEQATVPAPDAFAVLIARLERAFALLGEKDAREFREAFVGAVPSLHNFAMSLTKNAAMADDLVQDTLLRAWRSRERFEPGTNLGAWLFTIMRNAFYTAHRRHGREVPDSDGEHAGRLAALPAQGGHLDLQDAEAAMARLPAPMRQALVLVAVENLSYEEAAVAMNCRIGTVKSRVWRAREQLAALLGYEADEVGADRLGLSAVGSLNV